MHNKYLKESIYLIALFGTIFIVIRQIAILLSKKIFIDNLIALTIIILLSFGLSNFFEEIRVNLLSGIVLSSVFIDDELFNYAISKQIVKIESEMQGDEE
jgi:uncharacterized membrane protein